MRCEKCNDREANFFYTATINGETSQRSLCSACAAEEGLDNAFESRWSETSGMLESFFGRSGFFGGGLAGGLMPTMVIPTLMLVPAQKRQVEPEAAEAAETKIPLDAGDEVKARRELVMLRYKLDEAVRTEDFEKAIELRDKIKEIEK